MSKVLKRYILPLCTLLLGFSGYLNANSHLDLATLSTSQQYHSQKFFTVPQAHLPETKLDKPVRKENSRIYSEENKEETSRPNFLKKHHLVAAAVVVFALHLLAFAVSAWLNQFDKHYFHASNRRYILLRILRI